MKKIIVSLSVTAMALGMSATSALAAGSGAGISGSPHDLSGAAYTGGQTCNVCHVPHDKGSNNGDLGLLWSHGQSTATYLMYAEDGVQSNFLQGTASTEPLGVSKLCLGCHDGTVAIDDFTGSTGTGTVFIGSFGGGYAAIPGIADVGADKNLSNTHPISITYDNVADPGLRNPASTAMGLSGVINDVLDNGRVECSSCHDVHDQESVAGTALLRVDIANSSLCLACHIK